MKSEYRKHIDRMFDYAIKATSLQAVFESMMDSLCEDNYTISLIPIVMNTTAIRQMRNLYETL